MKLLFIALLFSFSCHGMDRKTSIVEIDTKIAHRLSLPQLEIPPSPDYPPIVIVVDSETVRRISGADQTDPVERTTAPAPITPPQRVQTHTPAGIASTNRAKICVACITASAVVVASVVTYLISRKEC